MPRSRSEKAEYNLLPLGPRTEAPVNLALEEYLLDTAVEEGLSFVFLCENEAAVVLGKNQNPWKELSAEALRTGFPRPVRRVSGGGTVYHGPGNLNVSFILPKDSFTKEAGLDLIRKALRKFGLEAERTPRGDLLIEGKKISGNALCYRRDRVLHHATLLVDADLGALSSALSAGGNGIETKAVHSVPMSVANLADFKPGLTVDAAAAAVRETAGEVWGCVVERPLSDFLACGGQDRLQETEKRYRSWEWNFGATPAFIWRPAPGKGPVVSVERGLIAGIEDSDGDAAFLLGRRFDLSLVEGLE